MANSFYTHGSFPTTGSPGSSASMRAELDAISAGFDKLPTLGSGSNFAVKINSTGTALVTSTVISDDGTSAKLGNVTITPVATAATLTIANAKTLTVSNTLTLAGTDASTLNIGSGGTLGTAAFTASTAYAPAAGSASITTLGTVTSGTWSATAVGIAYGGTGAATKAAAFNALTPMTTLGDTEYHDGTNGVRLAGNVSTTKKFLRQTGTGAASAAPAWDTLVDGDIPAALTGKTYNGLTLTAAGTGFTVAGGTTSKTLTVSNTLTLAGTDASTLNIGSGGTLGTAAFTASTAYAPAAGSTSVTTLGTVTSGTWTATAVGLAYGGTGATTKAAAFNALTPMTTLGDLEYHDGTNGVRLAGNTTSTKKFLRQTGTGAVSAAPAWDTLVDSDIPSALTGKTYNGLTLTAAATGFTVAGGTTSKTLTVSNTLTLAGTDASTLNIGSGGTLGTAAFTASTAYAPAAGSTSVTTLGTVTSGTWTATAVGLAYGGTGATTQIGALQSLGAIASNTLAKSAAYTVVAADRGDVLLCTGTWTLSLSPASSLANGFSIGAVNVSTGTITIDPNGAETVDGLTTKPLLPGQSCILITDGTSWRTVGLSGGGGAAAWVNFNGVTLTATIRASDNVSSVTRNGTGDYTVNFTNALADANYSVNALASFAASNARMLVSADSSTAIFSTSSVRLKTVESTNGALSDPSYCCVSVFR